MHVKLRHARVDLKRGTRQNAFIGWRRICIDYPDKGQTSPDDARGDDAADAETAARNTRGVISSVLVSCVIAERGMRGLNRDVPTEREKTTKISFFIRRESHAAVHSAGRSRVTLFIIPCHPLAKLAIT